jgi:ABC-type glutathione transport system ATPase component
MTAPEETAETAPRDSTTALALEARGLSKTFVSRTGLWSTPKSTRALADASFELRKSEILAIVGESGSGKSTLGRVIVGLERPDAGWVRTGETTLLDVSRKEFTPPAQRRIGMIYQDPTSSLNGRMNVGDIVGEGLQLRGDSRKQVRERVANVLDLVGLRARDMERYPHQFSGGQRQRIGIARALAIEPSILIADEAVSSLDVSVQMQVLNLILDIRDELGLAVIFITHNIGVVKYLCDYVVVMSRGKVVERGPVAQVLAEPQNAYTQRLLAAVPRL